MPGILVDALNPRSCFSSIVSLVTVKDEAAINTPAVAAAFAIKAYQAQDDSEISLEVSHSHTKLPHFVCYSVFKKLDEDYKRCRE